MIFVVGLPISVEKGGLGAFFFRLFPFFFSRAGERGDLVVFMHEGFSLYMYE